MKKLFLLLACSLFQFAAFAQNGGTDFRNLTVQEALDAAKAENKLVFVDCSTSWCGACRGMFLTVFPTQEAGDFFNANFVNIKLDMEKGEGPEFGKKYNVRAYPTFLLLRPDGSEQYRVLGGAGVSEFISIIKRGMDEKNSIEYLSAQYNSGDHSNATLIRYYQALLDANKSKDAAAIHQELSKQLTTADKLSAECWPYFCQMSYGSEDFRFVYDHEAQLQKAVGEKEVSDALAAAFYESLRLLAYGDKSNPNLEPMRAAVNAWTNPRKAELLFDFQIIDAIMDSDAAQLAQVLTEHANEIKGMHFDLAYLSLQKMRERRKSKDEYKLLADFVDHMLTIEKDADQMEKWIDWRHMLGYLSSKGVYFQPSTLQKAMEISQHYNNYIFVDCCTSWCGPCKKMANEVFTLPEVGEYMNSHFRSLKFDMEKGEGLAIGKKYGVEMYPTFLILDCKGNLVDKLVGYDTAENFLKKIKGVVEKLGGDTSSPR